ncbi:hypothetical protein Tco_0898826 [Tanacetum coccineum]
MIGAIGPMSFLTPLSVIQEESDILWKLILVFPDLRVMVPISNLIVALAIVRNGVPKLKGLFFMPFIGKSYVGGVGHNVHIRPLIYEGIHVLMVPYATRDFVGHEFLEKPEHFSHPAVDLLALLENGVLKSFHPFGVRYHVIP